MRHQVYPSEDCGPSSTLAVSPSGIEAMIELEMPAPDRIRRLPSAVYTRTEPPTCGPWARNSPATQPDWPPDVTSYQVYPPAPTGSLLITHRAPSARSVVTFADVLALERMLSGPPATTVSSLKLNSPPLPPGVPEARDRKSCATHP